MAERHSSIKMNLDAEVPYEDDEKMYTLFQTLTLAELKVMEMTAAGVSEKEMGKMLGISPHTINTHKTNILNKLRLTSAADLTRVWMKFGKNEDPFNEEETLP